jgi:cytidylate kinase
MGSVREPRSPHPPAARPIVVAIDGPAGSGKSTLAHRLALELDLPYLNTGLMYRAVALEAIRRGVDPDDAEGLATIARALRFDLDPTRRPPQLRIDGREPEPALRDPRVEALVSRVARHPQVRAVLRAEQRRLGAQGGVVEGRDIGSVVFPEATLRVVLVAHPRERTERRARELGAGPTEEISRAIEARDRQDRANVPPVEPDLELDSTGMSPDRVLEVVLAALRERLREEP